MNASERRAGYLDDLGRLLQDMTPVERIAVIDRVRDKIDKAIARLGHEASGEEMAGILAGVGAVEDVAEEALASRSESTPAASGSPAPADQGTAASGLESPAPGAAEPVTDPFAPSGSASTRAAEATDAPTAPESTAATAAVGSQSTPSKPRYDLSNIPAMEWPEDAPPRPAMTKRWVMLIVLPLIGLGSFFAVFLLPALALIVGAIVLWTSPLWQRQERVIGTVVPAIGLGAFLPLLALGSGQDGSPGLLLLALVLVVAGFAALIWLAIRGARAAKAVDAEMAEVAKKYPRSR